MNPPQNPKKSTPPLTLMAEMMTRVEKNIRHHHSAEKRKCALSWGFDSLDRLTLGLQPGRVAVLASETPAHPRWMVWQMVHRLATCEKIPVAVYTKNLSPENWTLNLALRAAGLSRERYWRLELNQKTLEHLRREMERIKTSPITFITAKGADILRAVKEARSAQGARLLVMDPIEVLGGISGKPEEKNLESAMAFMKKLANKTSLAVVGVHPQRYRDAFEVAGAMEPELSDADFYAQIEWKNYSLNPFGVPINVEPENSIEVHVRQNVDGGSGLVRLHCNKNTLQLSDLHPRSDAQQLIDGLARKEEDSSPT